MALRGVLCGVLASVAVTGALAAFAVPSAAQNKSLVHTFTQFMHYGPCTFVGCQWDIPYSDPSVFAPPDDASTDGWVETAAMYGATQICLTVRHVDGFSLWPTSVNNYSVASSPWRGGKGDVVADFVASVRKYGLSPCFYIILGFNVYANKTGVPGPEYVAQQVTALTELLTNYGPIDRLWWDNYALDGTIYQPVTHEGFVCPGNAYDPVKCPAWKTMIDTVRQLSPNTAIFPGPDGCLVNAESSGGTYPVYHATTTPMGAYWCSSDVSAYDDGPVFTLPEADYTIENPGDNWFWKAGDPFLTSLEIAQQVDLKLGQGANLIFNVPPNSSAVIPDEFVQQLAGFAAARNATYAAPAAQLAAPITAVCSSLSFTVPVSGPFDRIVTTEDMGAGQIIGGYSVEALIGGTWTPLSVHGKTVGSRIQDDLSAPVVGATSLRFNCTADLSPPTPYQFVNENGDCLGIPAGATFPCWVGGTNGQTFHLCPLVASPCSAAGNTSVWRTNQGGVWSSFGMPGVMLNIDCDNCAVGTHAKAMIEASSPLSWNAATNQIEVGGCGGMCLTTGIAPGALPSCAGNETWFPTQVHVDLCSASSTQGWTRSEFGVTVAGAGLQATVASFGAYLRVNSTWGN